MEATFDCFQLLVPLTPDLKREALWRCFITRGQDMEPLVSILWSGLSVWVYGKSQLLIFSLLILVKGVKDWVCLDLVRILCLLLKYQTNSRKMPFILFGNKEGCIAGTQCFFFYETPFKCCHQVCVYNSALSKKASKCEKCEPCLQQ